VPGAKLVVVAPLTRVSQQSNSHNPLDPLDELVTQLLDCGGVLSQMIAAMVGFEASGRSTPDTEPIPDVAHSVIRSVLGPIGNAHSKRDIRVAAKIVDEVTARICAEIYSVSPEFIDDHGDGG